MTSVSAAATAAFFAFSISIYYFPKDQNRDHDNTNQPFPIQSQVKEIKWDKVPPPLIKDKDELQLIKNSTKLNQRDELFFKPAFTAVSLDKVVFILLIHSCGAGLVSSISTVLHNMTSAGVLVYLAVSFIAAVYFKKKMKRENAEMRKENTLLKEESLNKDKDQKDVVTTLTEVKTELENQKGQIKKLLEEVEREREVNKQTLQAVENEIIEREMTFDKPEELLREKENLLREQWKLDQRKKDSERQLLNFERLLEPIEIQVDSIHRMQEVDQGY